MALRTILRFPNPGLRTSAMRVDRFDENLQTLVADLLETLRAAQALGITAPHVGIAQRIALIELSAEDGVRSYVNPQIVWASAETAEYKEGSVSMPDVLEEIERPARVRVRYQDLAGVEQIEEADGLLATCLQHEIDQLDGIFWIDKLSRLKRERVIKRFEKLQRLSRNAATPDAGDGAASKGA
jgi:peptide deformylase